MSTRPIVLLLLALTAAPRAMAPQRATLGPADVEHIAQLLMMEDTRAFDEDLLAETLRSQHPEVRRRAAIAIGRLADPRGLALLSRTRTDVGIAREVAFAYGQLRDGAGVEWLAGRLMTANVPDDVRYEAARSLGKIRTPAARAALETFLNSATAASPAIGQALLSLGRFPDHGEDLSPILRWARASNTTEQVTWQAAWALYRPRDPAAVPDLLRLSEHPDPEVRFWVVRGLAEPTGGVTPVVEAATRSARLREAAQDADRRVRTEALRALATFDDDASFEKLLEALDSPDTWLSVSAAEAMGRYEGRRDQVVPRLVAASARDRSTWLRVAALGPLTSLAPEAAIELAADLTTSPSVVARQAARQALGRLGDAGRTRLESLPEDPEAPNPVARGAGGGRGGGGAARGRGAGQGRGAPAPDTLGRSLADYRRIAARWVVPGINGAPNPVAVWETPRGSVEIALHAAEAPLAMEYLVRAVESGDIIGTEFGRLVPNFVAQQRTIDGAPRLRDEVNTIGLNRGTLAWASAGLDTGRPGYTLGHTPQPHNEGDFTALGHVLTGMDVVDRLELGDAITAARMR